MSTPQPYLYLVSERTDPTLPALYGGIAANDDAEPPAFMAAHKIIDVAFWIAIGVVAGLML